MPHYDDLSREELIRLLRESDASSRRGNADRQALRQGEERLRLAAEAARQRSEELAALLDALPAYVWISSDADCRVITGNRAANEIAGVVPGANVSQSAVADGKAHYLRQLKADGTEYRPDELPLQRAIATGQPVRDAYIDFRLPGGRRVEALGNASPLFDASGTVRGAVAALFDIGALKEAEAALQHQRQLLETVVSHMPAALTLIRGSDLRVRLVNPAYQAIAPGKEMLGKTLDELWPETGQNFTAICRRVLETGEPHQVVDELNMIRRRPDGPLEPAYFSWSLHRVRLPGEEGWGLLNAAWETTERKLADAALRRSREDLDRAQEVGLIGWWRLDTRRNQLTWSEQNYRIFGVPVGSPLTYESFLEIVHPEDRAYVDSQWKAGLAGAPYDVEHRLLVGGRVKWVREKAFLEFDGDGSLLGGFGITQDITERKTAETALRESEARFQLASEIGRSGTWDWDVASGEVVWSRGHFEILGYHPGEVTPSYRAWADRVHPADLPEVEEEIRRTMAAHADYGREFRVVWPDGSTHWISARARYEYAPDGACRRMLGVMADVTELKEAEHRARELNARLAALLAERTRLIETQAAHLRELAVELTQAEQRERERLYELLHDEVQPLLVGARLKLSGLDKRSKIETWVGSAAEVRTHITAALDTARSLSLELNPPLLRREGLAAALGWLSRWVKDHHGLDVRLECDADAEPADGAARLLLFKAVRELLLNVAKHARTDTVRVQMKAIPRRMMQITVADQGVGFDAAARAGGQDAQSGSGLYDIERRLGMIGGRMEVTSSPDRGTTIRLSAPLVIRPSGITGAREPTPRSTTAKADRRGGEEAFTAGDKGEQAG